MPTPLAIRFAKRSPETCAGARGIFRFSKLSKLRCSKSRTKKVLQRRWRNEGTNTYPVGRMPSEEDCRKTPAEAPKADGGELPVNGVPRRTPDARPTSPAQTPFPHPIF